MTPFSADNLPDFLLSRIESFGDQIAQVDSVTGEELTFRQMLLAVHRSSEWLHSQELGPGSVVGISLENSLDYAPLLLGVLQAGAVAALYPPTATPRELEHLISTSKPDVIVSSILTAEHKQLVAKSLEIKILKYSRADVLTSTSREYIVENCPAKLDSTAFLLSSSGSTGMPKEVIIRHSNILWIISTISDLFMKAGKPTLGLMPFYHAYGLGLMLMALAEGSTNIIMNKFTLEAFNNTLVQYKIHCLHIVPSLMNKLATDAVPSSVLRTARLVMTSAGSVSPKAQATVLKKLHPEAKLYFSYGLTESTHTVAYTEARADKPGSTGVILPYLKAMIITFDGRPGRAGEQGELCLKGPSLTRGYYNCSAASEELYTSDGWLRTGDFAWIDSDGYLYIVDRIKDIIKFQGFTVSVIELEHVIVELTGVQEVAVIGVRHEMYGEVPRAYIVKENGSKLTEKEVQQAVSSKLSYYKWLRGGVKFLESLPKTQTMKINRKALRAFQ